MNTIKIETLEQVQEIIREVREVAQATGKQKLREMGDYGCCGFAWVNIYEHNGKKIDGRTKLGKLLQQAGVAKSWNRTFQIWNPGAQPVQSLDIHEAGAYAAAQVLRKYGFKAYAGSRMD